MDFEFGNSNDPWIRNGAVLLFNYIDSHPELVNSSIKLNLDELKIECNSIDELKKFLQSVINKVQNNEYILSKRKDMYLDDDGNLKETPRLSFSFLTKFFFKGIHPTVGKELKLEELNVNQKTEYNNFTAGMDIKEKRDVKIRTTPSSLLLFDIQKFKNNKYGCDFCGRNDILVDNIKTTYYPFIASLNKYKNFHSNFNLGTHICLMCAVSSFMVFTSMPYLGLSDFKSLFFALPIIRASGDDKSIWKLLETKSDISVLNKFSNFSKSLTGSEFHAFIKLIIFIDNQIRVVENEKKWASEKDIVAWEEMSWLIGYAGEKIIKNLYTYEDTKKIFDLIKELDFDLSIFLNNFRIKVSDQEINYYENEISRKIMYMENINQAIELFFINVHHQNSIKYLKSFLYKYNIKVMRMDEKLLNNCYYIGATIGEYSRGDELKGIAQNKDILYELRSCTNLKQFLQFLDSATFDIEDLYISKNFLEGIDDANWQNVKSLISIFAHNKFYEKRESKSGDNK